ncbi:MAG: ABC transporter permease, partial [Blautia sp.]|nr:ABC transporter permease [Blautia sp.]
IGKDKDWEDGAFKEITPMEFTDTPAEDAKELVLDKRIFPHVFGTDSQGRDLMARCMYGARVSIIIGVMAALIVLVIGALYGSISGYAGGAVDAVMMRIVDLIYSVPDVLIVLLLQVVLKEPLQHWFDTSTSPLAKAFGSLGVGIVSIFITFALLYWVGMARIIRGQVLQLKAQEYVTAATALGASFARIIRRHLLPNCVGQLIIQTCLQIPSAIFLESFLSYLGLGVSAPMASLGSLCSDAKETFLLFPYRLLFPAILLSLIVLTLNLVGDGLRDALDPRLKN